MCCIVLYIYIYIGLLEVHTNQKRFQCERLREKRAVYTAYAFKRAVCTVYVLCMHSLGFVHAQIAHYVYMYIDVYQGIVVSTAVTYTVIRFHFRLSTVSANGKSFIHRHKNRSPSKNTPPGEDAIFALAQHQWTLDVQSGTKSLRTYYRRERVSAAVEADITCMRVHSVSEKTVQNCFCQNFVKFPSIVIIFGR